MKKYLKWFGPLCFIAAGFSAALLPPEVREIVARFLIVAAVIFTAFSRRYYETPPLAWGTNASLVAKSFSLLTLALFAALMYFVFLAPAHFEYREVLLVCLSVASGVAIFVEEALRGKKGQQ